MRDFLLGFDLGTSAIKAILVDTSGTIIDTRSRDVEFITRVPRRFEIDADVYFDRVVETIAELSAAAPEDGIIRGLCFCAASGNTILLDSEFRPVRNVISWLDERTRDDDVDPPTGIDRDSIRNDVGWGWNGIFPLAHLEWLRKHEPDAWSRAAHIGMNNDYLYYRLTRRFVVDTSKATTFYLQDQVGRRWNERYLEALGIEEKSLPRILPSATIVGTIDDEIHERTGLPEETIVATGSFDHPSAARSTGVLEEGDLLISAGTSWVVFAPVRDRSVGVDHEMLTDPFLSPDGCWGVMLALTAVANRIDDILHRVIGKVGDIHREFDALAANSRPGSGGLLINPWEQTVDEIVEAFAGHGIENGARALMEGCAFLMRNRIENLCRIRGGDTRRVVMVGGPTKSPIWPQILADILGITISIPEAGAHAGAMGAALQAGLSLGLYTDERDAFRATRKSERIITPTPENGDLYDDLYKTFAHRFLTAAS